MRLTGLNLSRYGNFDSQRIVFDPAPGRINLLVAPNGAGKSIIRQAFCDLLFGIHGQTPMGFRFGYNGMKLMAEAIGPDRAPFSFGRRKGQGNTLIDADGTPLPGAELARLLGHTDRALLERLFALDTERLRTGGKELLASDGAVADALLSAAGGLRQARQLRLSLEAGRDNQAPVRKVATRPFYLALDRFINSGRQLRNVTVKPEAHEKQATELRHLEAEQVRLNKVAAHASHRIARLERIRRVVGVLATHDDAATWLRDHPNAPALPPDTRQRLTDARSALLHAERLLDRETGALQALAEQIDTIVVDAPLIGQTEAIEHLIDRAGAARQADRDIPQRQTEHDSATDRIGALLRQLGLSLPVGCAAEAIPRKADMVRARNLFTEHETSRATLQRLPPEIAEAVRELDATERIVRALPAPRVTPDLLRLTREILAAGDPEKTAAAASRAVTERQTSLAAALARAPGWTGDAEALIALGILPRDACQRLDAACAEAERVFDRTAQELECLQRDLAQSRKDLATIAGETTMPDSAAIVAARAHRDSGWRLIYRRAFTAEPALLVQEQEWAGQGPVPLAYQHSVAAADDLADRRNQESDRVAKAAELQRHINETETEIVQAETSRRAAAQVRQDARANWQNACAPLGLIAPTLSDVILLLDARERVIDARRDLTLAQGEQAALQHRHAEWTARLTAALGRNDGTLSALLAFADEIITAAANTETERVRLQERLAAQRRLHDGKLAELRTAGERRDDLHRDWSAVRQALARPASEDPATTNALLDLYGELDTEQRSVTELGRRLQQMHDELAAFRTEAAALAQRIAPDLVHADGFDLVAELRRRLTAQRDLAERRKTLTAQLKRADATVANQRKQHASCVDALRTNLQIVGAATIEAAEARIAAAEQRAAQQAARDRAAQELREKGDGRTIDQLRDEVVSVPIDQVEGNIAELGRERDAANADAQSLAAEIATKRSDLNRQARDTEAQAAAADQQSAIATIGHVLDEAALMHLASLLLQSSLDTVEAAGTSVLMARISELFRTITDGAYQRIEAEDPGDGSARLVAVERQFPDERKGVADLSEGSRDQLFLALRLAAIEEHVATAPPLPFLGDDILQTFDDDRAAAAMEALVQLSESVQVILLSHHRHLLALARRLPPEQVHVCEIAPSLVA